jgi:hypothetical protein
MAVLKPAILLLLAVAVKAQTFVPTGKTVTPDARPAPFSSR